MARTAKVSAASLIEDLAFYPRASVDGAHVAEIAAARLAGYEVPPVIAERKSKRLVDGFHRRRGELKAFGPEAMIDVEWREYANDAALFEDAVLANAHHGRKLTSYDHTRIGVRAGELGIPPKQIAVIIHRDEDYVQSRLVHVAVRPGDGGTVALKRPLRSLAGTTLTAEQENANEHSSGWSPSFHAHQLIMLIEAGTVEVDEEMTATLARLRELIEELV